MTSVGMREIATTPGITIEIDDHKDVAAA